MKTKEERRAERAKFDAYLKSMTVTEDDVIRAVKATGVTPTEVADFMDKHGNVSLITTVTLAKAAVLNKAITATMYRDIESYVHSDRPTKAQKFNFMNAYRFVAAWCYLNQEFFFNEVKAADDFVASLKTIPEYKYAFEQMQGR